MPDLLFAYNLEDTNILSSGIDSIFRETIIFDYQWSTNQPSFLISHLHRDRLQDSAWEKYNYFYLTFGQLFASSQYNYFYQQADAEYKFIGL